MHDEGKPPKYQWSGILILLVKNETFEKRMRQKEFSPDFSSAHATEETYISDLFSISYIYRAWNIGSILLSDIDRQCSSRWIEENAHDFINRSDIAKSFQGNP